MSQVGIEEEFHIVDLRTRQLAPVAPELLPRLPATGFTAEEKQTCVEFNGPPHRRLSELRVALERARALLSATAAGTGHAVLASGSAPLTNPGVTAGTRTDRYDAWREKYAQVAEEHTVCGMHVHVEIDDRDQAAQAIAWISPYVPVFLALTASSPFWFGRDTGYASWRTVAWQRWPSAGPPGRYKSAAHYESVLSGLVRTGVVLDPGMDYQDVRLSSHLPTVELRVCDANADLDAVILVAGLFRALVRHSCRQARNGLQPPDIPPSWQRAATWQAARTGLGGDLIDPVRMTTEPAEATVAHLVGTLEEDLAAEGDLPLVRELARRVLAAGDSATRQRRAAEDGRLSGAVDLLIRETRSGACTDGRAAG